MRLAIAGVGAAAGALAVGMLCCGGSTSGGGSSSGGGGASAATVAGFAQDFCALLAPCCADAGLSTSGLVCSAFIEEAAQKGTYDATAGQACLAAAQQQPASDFCANLGNDVPQCSQVLSSSGGTTQPGQPCTQDSDCARASGGSATCFGQTEFLDGGGTTQTMTCVQTSPGQAGQGPCIGIAEPGGITEYTWGGKGTPPDQAYVCSLADGVTCSSTTQTCTALAAAGSPCTTDSDCVSGAYCAFGSGGSSTCTARLADGAGCASAPNGCQTTSYCDASQVCTPYVAPGSACTTGNECQYGCVNGKCSSAGTSFGLALLCGG